MAKYRMTMIVDAEPYHAGLEDGIVYRKPDGTLSWPRPGLPESPKNVLARHPDYVAVPYIKSGRKFYHIEAGDFIVTREDGERYPIRKKTFLKHFHQIAVSRTVSQRASRP